MPIQSGYVAPKAPEFPLLPADVYAVEIADVEAEVKPNPFKNEEDTREELHQYKFSLKFLEEGLVDRKLSFWTNTHAGATRKGVGLADLLKILMDKVPTPAEITPEFINTLIGSKLRVTVTHRESKTGKISAVVSAFLKPKV